MHVQYVNSQIIISYQWEGASTNMSALFSDLEIK